MSRKKPTIKELNKIVIENRQGIEIAFKGIDEVRNYVAGIDRLLDWYIEYKKDIDGYKKFIEENKVPDSGDNPDGTKDGVSNKREDILEGESSEVISEKPK